MKFTQPCLIIAVENKAIDWALYVAPGEEHTKEQVSEQCDKSVDTFYVYPVMSDKSIMQVSEQLEFLGDALVNNKPLEIPGVFVL